MSLCRSRPGLYPLRLPLDRLRRFSRLCGGFYGRDALYQPGDDTPSFGVRLALGGQLLAAAEAFADAGSERVALTEAVTALEVAVSRFMDSPKADYQLSEPLGSRLGLESLKGLKKRQRGLMASISFPLPILFDSDTLSSETLATCREAIRKRNKVVHDGLLYIDPGTCWRFLGGIRNLCEVLQEATASQQRNNG